MSAVVVDDDTWSGDEMRSLFVVTDLTDEAFAHQATRHELGSVVVHFLQQLLASIVDEADTREID